MTSASRAAYRIRGMPSSRNRSTPITMPTAFGCLSAWACLADVDGAGDDLVALVLLEPADGDRRVEAAEKKGHRSASVTAVEKKKTADQSRENS